MTGVWTGLSTLVSATSSSCIGPVFQDRIGRSDVVGASFTQTGSTLSATITGQNFGVACSYTGTATAGTATVNVISCQAGTITGARCADGTLLDLALAAAEVRVVPAGNRATGTQVETWNVFESGTSNPAGVLTLNSTVVINR